ncbi:hypothetical protein [Chryseobacterium sp. M5A1_1a]
MKEKFQISSPCSQDWDSMEQVSEDRFCDECNKKVWDFDHLPKVKIDKI